MVVETSKHDPPLPTPAITRRAPNEVDYTHETQNPMNASAAIVHVKMDIPSHLLTAKQLASSPTTIQGLPYDIIAKIFKHCGIGLAVCLGLTCHQLYAFLKIYHPRQISLDNNLCTHHLYLYCCKDCVSLGEHLERSGSSITSGYRVEEMGDYSFRLLNHNIYGETASSPLDFIATRLWYRYHEYKTSFERGIPRKVSELGWVVETRDIACLPCPHNLGDAWYDQAWAVVAGSLESHNDVKDWKRYWKRFEFVMTGESRLLTILEEYRWARWSDTRQLFGL